MYEVGTITTNPKAKNMENYPIIFTHGKLLLLLTNGLDFFEKIIEYPKTIKNGEKNPLKFQRPSTNNFLS